MAEVAGTEEAPTLRRKRRWGKRIGWAIAILMTPVLLAAAFLSSPIGKRWVADQIAEVAPASGLRFEVGRIEGDIYGAAVLRDVVVKDPKGTFLTIPEVSLDWRPLAWLWSGIDIRELTARRGRLERLPELVPGDPDAPFLPDFDIRVDRFAIDSLTLAPGLAGEAAQRVNLVTQIDIRDGRALVDAEGTLGRADRIDLLLDARPDDDRFDLALDYSAAADGPIARLAGLSAAYDARIKGTGSWTRWLGHALVTRTDGDSTAQVAGFQLTNDAGVYGVLGQVRPTLADGSILDRALGPAVSVVLRGTLEESVFSGDLAAVSTALDLRASGALDLAGNRAEEVAVRAMLREPDLLGETARLEGAQLTGVIDGAFRDLSITHDLRVEVLDADGIATAERLVQSGTATYDGERWRVPLNVIVGRVVSGNGVIDPRLVRGTMVGMLSYADGALVADNTRITFPDLRAELSLRGDTRKGVYALAGPVTARGVAVDDLGRVTANAKLLAKFGSGVPWSVTANLSGVLGGVTNATIANLAGDQIRFDGSIGTGAGQPIIMRDVAIGSQRLYLTLDSRIVGDRTSIAGAGQHTEYGDFTFDAEIAGDGPRATLVLADPYPPAGLTDVRLGIAPDGDGFAVDVAGGSLLGDFAGRLGVVAPANAPVRIAVDELRVYRTSVTGALTLEDGGVAGRLALAGGGLNGTIALAPGAGRAQGFDLDLAARQARFDGPTPLSIAFADIDASGSFGANRSRIDADIAGTGFAYGALTIAAFDAKARIIDGRGEVQGAIAGRRADRFALKFDGRFTPERIEAIAQGEYGGSPISMPRRAVLTRRDDGAYTLAPTQIGFARGFAILEGTLGGETTALQASLSQMPLRLADLAGAELALGGRLSGVVSWNQRGAAPPTGSAKVRIDDFTRSGLVLSSKPIDVFAVADLSQQELALGARLFEGDARLGRLDARITQLGGGSDLAARLMRGRLDAQLGFDGAAESLWRFAAIQVFDLTGPLSVSARATGTLRDPRITGTLSSDALRLQSAISGTDITGVTARGRFAGSRLELTRFAGKTRGDGTVSGSGFVDFAGMSAARGPQIDIRAGVRNARLINANGLEATITGPLRIVSQGSGGSIAGRVRVERASWALGTAAEDRRLPVIATREINRSDRIASATPSASGAWRYLVDATANDRVAVRGLGLESEWGIDIALRGTVDDPRIGGEARLVRGDYTFAGTRFELTEGRIVFDQGGPINPQLDIEATANANSTNVTIDITGNAAEPQIAFTSVPALPQEEILARLLFGGSVTSLSATDAVQLAAALAALQSGGGGIDPIGRLRRSIGLDQLRIISADPALGRGTGVALGKNIGRGLYVELVTDGQGYSATQIEYRITSWLALLATVTTVGRDSAVLEISRDY